MILKPKAVLVGFGLQLIVAPLLALFLTWAFRLSPGWAVGLALLAAIPGGSASNLLTLLANGNVALSITLTGSTTLLSLFSVPFILQILVAKHVPEGFHLPVWEIVVEIYSYLLAPLVVGMLLGILRPAKALPWSKLLIRASVVLVLAIIVLSLGGGRIDLFGYGWSPPLSLISFGLLLVLAGRGAAKLAGLDSSSASAITIEIVIRNVALALAMVQFFFPNQTENHEILFSCLFFAGVSWLCALPEVLSNRKRVLLSTNRVKNSLDSDPAAN